LLLEVLRHLCSLPQPTIDRFLKLSPNSPLAKPSVRFDLYQRASRALFASIWVLRALHLVFVRDFFTKSEWIAEVESDLLCVLTFVCFSWLASRFQLLTPLTLLWYGASREMPYSLAPQAPSSALTRGICTFKSPLSPGLADSLSGAGYLGWNSVDTVDLFILWLKFGVFQADMMQHHIMGLALWGYVLWANRALYLASVAFITELLVPCGFCLWWLRFSGASEAGLKIVRMVGTFILLGIRLPFWIYIISHMWFAPGWTWRVGMPSVEPYVVIIGPSLIRRTGS
jgi:hypothetical protein